VTGGVHAPAVLAAVRYVHDHPGCNLLQVAEHVGRITGRRIDYDPVHRALDLQLIEHRHAGDQCGHYRLHLTPAGWSVLNAVNGLPSLLSERLPDASVRPGPS